MYLQLILNIILILYSTIEMLNIVLGRRHVVCLGFKFKTTRSSQLSTLLGPFQTGL